MNREGLSFEIVTAPGKRFPCHTALLGMHNVENILLAVAVARELDVPWESIQSNIATLQAPPHRLQAMVSSGGVRIIDDAFNSNPTGFAMAMDVLATFPRRRILVTPGLVSLGRKSIPKTSRQEDVQRRRRTLSSSLAQRRQGRCVRDCSQQVFLRQVSSRCVHCRKSQSSCKGWCALAILSCSRMIFQIPSMSRQTST